MNCYREFHDKCVAFLSETMCSYFTMFELRVYSIYWKYKMLQYFYFNFIKSNILVLYNNSIWMLLLGIQLKFYQPTTKIFTIKYYSYYIRISIYITTIKVHMKISHNINPCCTLQPYHPNAHSQTINHPSRSRILHN